MTFQKYKYRKYDKKYPELFRREKSKLRKILGKKPEITHVGSTAIPGLGGKGVIDILISVSKKQIIKTKDKKIIVLDVTDSRIIIGKKYPELSKLNFETFQKKWTKPKLRKAINPYLPLKN
ncbi:MAG: GrpB family protein [Nanoarchaeota archaeon]|nr:GrpB family protein [Nanoarchaeota archaeon]